jgi:hypothetical protein
LERLPGDLPCPASPAVPSVAATDAKGTTTAWSNSSPRVLTTIVWPGTSAPGAWPVWMVVTPCTRSHSTSVSRALYASMARSSG